MPNLGPMEILLIVLVILLLFGFKKLPDAARSIGKSARVFKAEVSEMKEEDRARESAKKGESAPSTDSESTTTDEADSSTENQSGPSA
ncbi:Sec-independent protein translocase subunit TatA [Janibacter corallicola]|uniref:Sec-independent protein translocase subunit TatA n=1 Tax=Janibacter corallicola TaxID=415212 RepID=UPI0008319CA4|nr:Sec-independent protein translocase subunit TatA [Janibacter corallicola]